MKIGLFFLISLVVQQNAVSGEALPELIQDAQAQTDELHLFMTSILLKFRMEMSNIVTGIVKDSLHHVFNSLEETQDNNNEDSSDNFDRQSDMLGKQISLCSAQADNDIHAAIKEFFFVFNPIHDNSFRILNTVLEQIVEWNLISNPIDIVEKTHAVLQANRDEFVSITVPTLEDELKTFTAALMLVPSSVSKCLNKPHDNSVDIL